MRLTVLTRASTEKLIALATVRTRLLNGDTAKDDLLGELIAEASSAMAGYWGRPFARQRYKWETPGHGGTHLLLPVYPVDPESITVEINDTAETDFVVLDPEIGLLYRAEGWSVTDDTDDPLSVAVTFKAGYVVPDQARTWATSLTLAVGDWLRPTSPSKSPLLFEITTAGSSGAGSEPTWPTTAGETVAVGTATATARTAQELPALIQSLAYIEVFNRYAQLSRVPGLSSQMVDGLQQSYFASQTGSDLAPATMAGLDRLRAA